MSHQTVSHDLQYALEFHANCDAALGDEIAAVREQERVQAVAVRDGRRQPSAADTDVTTYAFRIQSGRPPRRGELIECHVPALPPVRGTIHDVAVGRVVVALEADLGASVAEATLRRDSGWLLDSLRRRLACLRTALERGEATAPYSPERMLSLLNSELHYVPPGFQPLLAERGATEDTELNADQQEAVRRVLAQPTTVVWGPPGTGKSRTLAAAIAELVDRGQRVLAVTPSNTAADVLLAQLQPRLAEHPLAGRGVLQRCGRNLTEHLPDELRDLVIPELVVSRLMGELEVVRDYYVEERALAAEQGDPVAVQRLDAALAALEPERASIPAEVVRNALVTVTPIANVHLREELWRSYDAVFVDEASMVPLPDLALAIGLARGRVVIAGDWQQLGPVTIGRTRAVRDWLGRDVFRAAGVPELFAGEREDRAVVMLREQHRMPRAVASMLGELFYLDRLRTAAPGGGASPLPFASGSLVLVDTSGLAPTVSPGSRSNPVHARVVSEIVERFEREPGSGAARFLGIYALYRDQVAQINALLHSGRHHPDRRATTVHRAQGAEADVVVFDLCDAPPARPAALRAASWDSDGARLLCVGLSRAREAVVVVADVAHLQRTGGAVVRHLLERLAEWGEVIDARELVGASRRSASGQRSSAGRLFVAA
jgi:hypothetical protein